MNAVLTRRPVVIPADVREQLAQIAASKERPEKFTETHYVAQLPVV